MKPDPSSSSNDVNKVIRADYDDIMYMQLALEAQELWRNDPIFKPYYHESGLLMAEQIGPGRKSHENYRKLGCDHTGELMSPAEALERFPCSRAPTGTMSMSASTTRRAGGKKPTRLSRV
jgi:sarcosine oxidase/L-pipecolate oxidase